MLVFPSPIDTSSLFLIVVHGVHPDPQSVLVDCREPTPLVNNVPIIVLPYRDVEVV